MNRDLAGFCIFVLVFSLFFASRCLKGSIISNTEIQQQNKKWKYDSQNNLGEIYKRLYVIFYSNCDI